MAPTKKSIYRAPGAQHFQVVHRSQRDPLINDPEASQQVLKPVERANEVKKTGYTLAELEAKIDKSKIRENEGEAALYGITYDDSSYDYMSHLKPVGQVGGGIDSTWISAPKGSGVAPGMKSQPAGKGKGKAKAEDLLNFLEGDGLLASQKEVSIQDVWMRGENVPRELQGLQPDMDPHLRQVLEALEDDAFVDNDDNVDPLVEGEGEGDGGDWFDELVKGGERDEKEEVDWEFSEWGVDEKGRGAVPPKALDVKAEQGEQGEDDTWSRFNAFKAAQREQNQNGSAAPLGGGTSDIDSEEKSEMADTIGSLNAMAIGMDMKVRGAKKRLGRERRSEASGMSMSSSSMFRNEGLRTLDQRFDQIEKEYDMDDEEEDDEDEDYYFDDGTASIAGSQMSSISNISKSSLFSKSSAAPPSVSREDFDAILDDFLENYEVVGRRLRPALGRVGLTGPEKLAVLRAAVEDDDDGIGKEENRRRIMEIEKLNRGVRSSKEKTERVKREEDEGEKWDVESILSTYTNTENHPAVIRTRTATEAKKRAERLQREQAAGAAVAAAAATILPPPASATKNVAVEEDSESDDSGSETERENPRFTVSRPKGESKEDRRARKLAVKAERQSRRAEKKMHTETFGNERRKQLKSQARVVGNGRAADMSVGASRGVVSLS